ncbi:3-deoxy-manno-octulosonate cytidylyltransferase [hydrothermal vent metagenome]|uniref:3-deoxy-manno-octulosonate cytidylyltransferase n=1 Tax=hydrothermal vent metagenome TaxID=652676 RepID=A0A3B1C6J4_9ZZZZ
MKTVGVIPCRWESSRFPGKPLAEICGKPMLWHVWKQASKSSVIEQLVVATDDERIYDVCNEHRFDVVYTSKSHQTGTDRVSEVAEKVSGDIFVNIQGDEPLIDPEGIDAVASCLARQKEILITNGYTLITSKDDIDNPNVVKVITDRDNCALAYSRSRIPYQKEARSVYKRQLGLYAMTREAMLSFGKLERRYIEATEGVEMYRFLENGYRIKMVEVDDRNSIPVDLPEDVERVESFIKRMEAKND